MRQPLFYTFFGFAILGAILIPRVPSRFRSLLGGVVIAASTGLLVVIGQVVIASIVLVAGVVLFVATFNAAGRSAEGTADHRAEQEGPFAHIVPLLLGSLLAGLLVSLVLTDPRWRIPLEGDWLPETTVELSSGHALYLFVALVLGVVAFSAARSYRDTNYEDGPAESEA